MAAGSSPRDLTGVVITRTSIAVTAPSIAPVLVFVPGHGLVHPQRHASCAPSDLPRRSIMMLALNEILEDDMRQRREMAHSLYLSLLRQSLRIRTWLSRGTFVENGEALHSDEGF